MAFLVSPGVQVKEVDLTNTVPAVSSSVGAMAGSFQWGPVDEITTVGSETALVNLFGEPNGDTHQNVLAASQFLSYGNSLRVVRAVGASLNAGSAAGLLVKNDTAAETATGQEIVARYPGTTGNSLLVSICPANSAAFTAWAYKDNFTVAPATSTACSNVSGSLDECHIIVVDEDGDITGIAGTVLETYEFVSQARDATGSDGATNYARNVVNNKSSWIRMLDSPTGLANWNATMAGQTFDVDPDDDAGTNDVYTKSLTGGTDDNSLTVGETTAAYDMFADAETVDISLLFMGDVDWSTSDSTTVCNKLIAIAAARKDTVAFVSPPLTENTAAEVITWAGTLTHSSYAFADSSALYVYDKYKDKYRWIGASGAMAGLAANADLTQDAWYSPAGFSRGNLRNVTKLAYNPVQVDRDDLYKAGVNPIVSFPGAGIVLYGDKTLQTKPSAFDRINVRRLFIVLEKAISSASKASLFEFNDEFTRAQFRNMVEPFLRDVKGRRGITDFNVVCDDTNNTGAIVDANKFVADIYIKPARSINFITLNFIATRTGIEFSEIAGGN
jgi:phage tail sheath protein FI